MPPGCQVVHTKNHGTAAEPPYRWTFGAQKRNSSGGSIGSDTDAAITAQLESTIGVSVGKDYRRGTACDQWWRRFKRSRFKEEYAYGVKGVKAA